MSRKPTAPSPAVTMRRALSDPAMLGTVLVGDSWLAWRILLVAAMGESLTDDERVIFTRLTGREREPDVRVESLWAAVGRRGGKSRAIATLIVFIATLVDHSKAIVTGEKPIVLCLAPTARQGPCCTGLHKRHHRVDAPARAVDREQDGRDARTEQQYYDRSQAGDAARHERIFDRRSCRRRNSVPPE
jgi:hypothetical protein